MAAEINSTREIINKADGLFSTGAFIYFFADFFNGIRHYTYLPRSVN
jgi:hypothetical protein